MLSLSTGLSLTSRLLSSAAVITPPTPFPVNTTPPSISGTPEVGQTITAVAGTWTDADTVTAQWHSGGEPIAEETALTIDTIALFANLPLTYIETAVNGAQSAQAGSNVIVPTLAAPTLNAFADVVLYQGGGIQIVETSPGFTGEGLSYSVVGSLPAGVTLNANSGALSVDSGGSLAATSVTIRAANDQVNGGGSGGTVDLTFNLSVVQASNQVMGFDGNDGLTQPDGGVFYPGGSLDTAGFWMAGYAYFDGTNWSDGTLLSFGSSSNALKALSIQGNKARIRGNSVVSTTPLATPASPGWQFICAHIKRFDIGGADATFWRNAETQSNSDLQFSSDDVAVFDQVAIGHIGQTTLLKEPLTVPSCGFAWGLGDPTAMQAWVYNGGDLQDLSEYDFVSDANATIESYWAGHRVDDTSAFSNADIVDEVGALDTWATQFDAPTWQNIAPPWNATGFASIQSVTVEDAARDQIVVVATSDSGPFLTQPTIGMTEADFDIWSAKGFGPIRIQSASTVLAGNQATVTLTVNRDIAASEVLSYQAATSWYDDGANTGALENGSIVNNSAMADPATTTGLSYGRVAVEFDAAYVAGFYQDDLAYVVAPAGLQIVDTYPSAATAIDERTGDPTLRDVHGAQKNPVFVTSAHGYDGRNFSTFAGFRYQDSENVAKTLPLSLSPNDSFVKARSNIKNGSENGGDAFHSVFLEQTWGLHVSTAAPAANDFCPPLVGYDGTSARPVMNFDVSAVAAALPSYANGAIARPPVSEVIARVERHNLIAGQIRAVEERRGLTPGGITQDDGYGLSYANTMNAASICLIADDLAADKEEIVRGLASWGWQWYHPILNGPNTVTPDGGQSQYHPFPMMLALAWNGEIGSTIANIASAIPANLFGQTAELDASLVSAVMNPHGTAGETLPKSPNDSLPYASHRRLVSGVSGNVVTMATAVEAEIGGSSITNPKISHVGMRLRREGDGLTALITAEDADARTYDLDDATGFAASDTVFVVPPYEAVVGDFEWSVVGFPNNANSLGPETSYRGLNNWSGMVMGIRALGLMHADFEAWEGYVARANEADNPTAASDYPTHHSVYRRGPNEPQSPLTYNWDRDFWDAHWAAISTVPSTI